MDEALRGDAEAIVRQAIAACLPTQGVVRTLKGMRFAGRVYVVAVGKAAWPMAQAAVTVLPPVSGGLVITKHGHSQGPIAGLTVREAGHPVPDAASLAAADEALAMVEGLTAGDTVVFLLSGGASALFEKPLVPLAQLQDVTGQLLACGADIRQVNIIRKRLSAVKAGRFALACQPARVVNVILSDVLGDELDAIGSGPTVPDATTAGQALDIVARFGLRLPASLLDLLARPTPARLDNVESHVIGSVGLLCQAALEACARRGYQPTLVTDRLSGPADQAGLDMARRLRQVQGTGRRLALVAGGETVVTLTGQGLGGRNQHLALAACQKLSGLDGVGLISVGSDGTDGPTDAAGGYVDGRTADLLAAAGWDAAAALRDDDSYHALAMTGGLVITGPTGTNVNDIVVGLVRPADDGAI